MEVVLLVPQVAVEGRPPARQAMDHQGGLPRLAYLAVAESLLWVEVAEEMAGGTLVEVEVMHLDFPELLPVALAVVPAPDPVPGVMVQMGRSK